MGGCWYSCDGEGEGCEMFIYPGFVLWYYWGSFMMGWCMDHATYGIG